MTKTDMNSFGASKDNDDDELSLNNISKFEEEIFHIELGLFMRIMRDPKLMDGIPSYVNSRPIAMNIQLIETVVWLTVKKLLPLQEIHKAVVACEAQGKALQRNILPLQMDILNEAMISNNRILPKSLFLYWCKKCYNFLECSKLMGGGGPASAPKKKQASGTQGHSAQAGRSSTPGTAKAKKKEGKGG